MADLDNSGELSLMEYVVFMSLITADDASLKLSFRLFDDNCDGYISLDEFHKIVAIHPNLSTQDINESISKYFTTGSKLRYNEFVLILEDMKKGVMKKQFRELAASKNFEDVDKLPVSDCSKLLWNRLNHPLPGYILKRIHQMEKSEELMSIEDFLAFYNVCQHLDAVELTIRLHTTTGGTLTRNSFSTAMRICTGTYFSPADVRFVFSLFDIDHDDKLDKESFNYMRTLQTRNFSSLNENRITLGTLTTLVMGSVAAKMAVFSCYPFDKFKTRFQCLPIQLHPFPKTIQRIILREGISGLYTGVGSMLAVTTPEKMLKLIVSDRVRFYLDDPEEASTGVRALWKEGLAGAVSGLVQATLVNPFEQVRIKMQMHNGKAPHGVWKGLAKLQFKNWYVGYPLTLCRDVTFNVVFFTLFGFLKIQLRDNHKRLDDKRLLAAFVLATTTACLVTIPIDTVKSIFQYQYINNTSPQKTLSKLYASEGILGLYKGTIPRIIVSNVLFGLTIFYFELIQRYFAPGTAVFLTTWQKDLDIVRDSRIRSLELKLYKEYGLKMHDILDMKKQES
uniref:EF-hand domain-containing protein n=1 Tax=Arcella intermedia TaxID=1963864 RepID=A0A6B2L0V9_9EUKA